MNKKTGRKGDLSPEIHDTIIKSLEAGATQKTAFDMVGIHERTYYQWISKGVGYEKEADNYNNGEGRDLTLSELRYVQFAQGVSRARAKAKFRNISVIQACAVGGAKSVVTRQYNAKGDLIKEIETYSLPDWRAGAWYIERVYSGEFGKKEYQEISHTHKDKSDYDKLSVEQLKVLEEYEMNKIKETKGEDSEKTH